MSSVPHPVSARMRIAAQGFPYIGFLVGCGILLAWYAPTRALSPLFFGLGLFVAYFFRDPVRTAPEDERQLVSPADGKVVYAGPPRDGSANGRIQVSIFLSLFDVHINRAPLSGTIQRVTYTPGRFLPAYKPDASLQNEQNEVLLEDDGFQVVVRQIAGVVARRIVFFKKPLDRVERGERIGLIQFGSRVDVLLPASVALCVTVGDHVKGGESVLAERRTP